MGRMSELPQQSEITKQRLLKDYPSKTKSFLNFLHKTEAGVALSLRRKELINVA